MGGGGVKLEFMPDSDSKGIFTESAVFFGFRKGFSFIHVISKNWIRLLGLEADLDLMDQFGRENQFYS